MRLFISFIGIFICFNCNAQLIIDSSVVKKYNEAYLKIKKEYRDKLDSLSNNKEFHQYTKSLVFFTEYKTDTLNIEEYKPFNFGNSELYIFDSVAGKNINVKDLLKISEEERTIYLPLLFCAGTIYKDTLMTWVGLWDGFSTKIINGKVFSFYQTDYDKYDSVYSFTLEGRKFQRITVNATTVKLTMNTSDYKIGDTVYGEAEVQTDPFYYFKPYFFKNGYIKQRFRIKYFFKLELVASPSNPHF